MLRNRFIMSGFKTTIHMRRTIVAALYEKCVKLSMKSMTETNSGKLISLISADLLTIERGLTFASTLFAAPFINMIALYFLAKTVGWIYSLVVLFLWLLLMVM